MARQLVLIIHTLVKAKINGEMVEAYNTPNPSTLGPDTTELKIRGHVNYEVVNTGTVTCRLWKSIPLLPGSSYHPDKSNLLPFAENIPVDFMDDYSATRSAGATIDLPPLKP